MERRINRGHRSPKGRVGCDTAKSILQKKLERENRRQQVKKDNEKV